MICGTGPKMHDPNICTDCIDSERFTEWVRQNGEVGPCEIKPDHGQGNKVVSASALAKQVDAWFRESYTQGGQELYFHGDVDRPSFEQRGEPYQDIMQNELECGEEVVSTLAEHLPDASHRDIAQGAVVFYDDTQNYEAFADIEKHEQADQEDYWFENRFSFRWQDFCSTVQYKRRFFKLKRSLDALFGSPNKYEDGPIKPVYDLPVGTTIYRARLLDENFHARKS